MRIFMSVQIPTEGGNEAIKNGTLAQVIGKFIDTFRPEAAYFITAGGDRCAHFYFDMKDPTQMPAIAEPFFLGLRAKVTYCPAMTPEDVKKGLDAYMASR